jgi:hypothetical protein
MSETQFINPNPHKPGPWLVTTLSGAFAVCTSGLNALRAAYERSGHLQSAFEAPNAIVRVGTDERVSAEEMLAEWRNLGWPWPASRAREA